MQLVSISMLLGISFSPLLVPGCLMTSADFLLSRIILWRVSESMTNASFKPVLSPISGLYPM